MQSSPPSDSDSSSLQSTSSPSSLLEQDQKALENHQLLQSANEAIIELASQLMDAYPKCGLLHIKTASLSVQIHRRGRGREYDTLDISLRPAPALKGRKPDGSRYTPR